MYELEIRPISRKLSDINKFIQVPWQIYAGNKSWVPPLIWERRYHLWRRNPFFKHVDFQAWIAYRGTEAVGRISAQIDDLWLQQNEERVGYFGSIEAVDDLEVFASLFAAAETWLQKKSIERVIGPFNLGINQESGLLIDAFDLPQRFMMNYAHAYYAPRVEECGYSKVQDLYAYQLKEKALYDNVMVQRILDKKNQDGAKTHLKVRFLNKDNIAAEVEPVLEIFNDSWSNNWGFVQWKKDDFEKMALTMVRIFDNRIGYIAELDGETVAFAICLPDINSIIADLNGRLLPFGWFKILQRLKSYPNIESRIPLFGIKQKYQRSRLAVEAFIKFLDLYYSLGAPEAEISWILESNKGMNNLIINVIGGVKYKTYRVYTKNLVADQA